MMRWAPTIAAILSVSVPAWAEIGYELPAGRGGIAESASRNVEFGPDRYLVINGTVMRAQLGQTDLSPRSLMDRVEAEWLAAQPEPVGLAASSPEELTVGDAERDLRQPFRFDSEGWSMLGKFFGGTPDRDAPFLENFAKTGAVGEAAEGGSMLSAFQDPAGGVTDVWLMHLDKDFRPVDYLGGGFGDVGALPIVDDIAGYPGSRRGLTISEFSITAETHSVTFVGPGSLESHAAHYASQFGDPELMQAPTTRRSGEILLRFADRTRDIAVFIREGGPSSGDVTDIVQISSSVRSIQ